MKKILVGKLPKDFTLKSTVEKVDVEPMVLKVVNSTFLKLIKLGRSTNVPHNICGEDIDSLLSRAADSMMRPVILGPHPVLTKLANDIIASTDIKELLQSKHLGSLSKKDFLEYFQLMCLPLDARLSTGAVITEDLRDRLAYGVLFKYLGADPSFKGVRLGYPGFTEKLVFWNGSRLGPEEVSIT